MMSLNIHSVLAVTLAFGLSVTDAQIDAVGTCDPTGGMYDGFRCKQSCSAVTCAVGCKGCECGLDCTGANCAENCNGFRCGAGCIGAMCGFNTRGHESATACTGAHCGSTCEGFECAKTCIGAQCAEACVGERCGHGCLGVQCAKECRGFQCAANCNGLNCNTGCVGEQCDCVDSDDANVPNRCTDVTPAVAGRYAVTNPADRTTADGFFVPSPLTVNTDHTAPYCYAGARQLAAVPPYPPAVAWTAEGCDASSPCFQA